jgi:hypothetical protein
MTLAEAQSAAGSVSPRQHLATLATPIGEPMHQPPAPYPSRQKLAARDRSLPLKVTGRLKVAIEAMVWQAASRKDAAAIAGMTDHSLRQALRRSHVMHHYLRECEVLRQSGKAKRLHRLEEIAASDKNQNAAVAAIKAAEQLEEQAQIHARGMQAAPGLVIVLERGDRGTVQPIEKRVAPVIEHEAAPLPVFKPDEG